MGQNIPQEPALPDSMDSPQWGPSLRKVLRDLSRAANDAMDERIWRHVTATAAYTASSNDHVILVDQSSATTITLPDAGETIYKRTIVKDIGGNAGTYTITIQWNGGSGAIDGGTSATITTNYGYAHFYSDGVQYWTTA